MSQSALVRSIRQLEAELGTALFKRSRNAAVLTAVGEIFARRAAAAQAELDRAADAIGRDRDTLAGAVSIGMSESPLAAILPGVLESFRQRFARTRLRVVEGSFAMLERQLRDGTLDFCLGPVWPQERTEGLDVRRLYASEMTVLARKDHPLAAATSWAELSEAHWIAPSSPDLDRLFERRGLAKPTAVVEAQTGIGMIAAVAASDALLLLPVDRLPLVEAWDQLTRLPLEDEEVVDIHLLMRADADLGSAAGCLHDLMCREASRL